FFGDLNIVIDDYSWWVIAAHERFKTTRTDKEELGTESSIAILRLQLCHERLRCLRSDAKSVWYFLGANTKRDKLTFIHLLDSKNIFGKRQVLFDFPGIQILKTDDSRSLTRRSLFAF